MGSYDDTIVAPATPPGEGGIAIVRLSGPTARAIAARVFDRPLRDHRIAFGHVRDPHSGEDVDEAIGILMRAPRSFTREDVVELHVHGSSLVVQRVMSLLLAEGARAAEPGEFTLRAFLNGRLDLTQAEAVLDVVRARTHTAHRLAIDGLRGRVGDAVRAVREQLLSVLAYLVARIDFPDEDVPAEQIEPALTGAAADLDRILAGSRAGALYRDGARVALVGPPNAGKSSLLNRLLRHDRAIVTPVAGTTRDTLEETANIAGIPVVLIDTAGISAAPGPIEALGIERSERAAAAADALLVVLDASEPPPATIGAVLALTADRSAVVALNKSDLGLRLSGDTLPLTSITVSALTGEGVAELERALAAALMNGANDSATEVLVANPRHADCLRRARTHVQSATTGAAQGLPEDFIAIDVRAALDALGEVTGETAGEELLDTIFKRFCIGK